MSNELWQRLWARLWERQASGEIEYRLILVGRYLMVLAQDLAGGQLTLRAMSLVYTTLLSLVPVLALAFSLFKALGIHNALEPVLLQFFAPLGAQGDEITRNVITFVENIRVGVLGALGVGLLLYTVISMIQKIESSFNYVWRIEQPRRLGQRFGEYLSVVIVGPILVFSAVGITASVLNNSVVARLTEIEPFGLMIYLAGKLVPYLLIIGAFTFLYMFIPNTRVRLRPALAGGLLAGVLWQSASLGFASFVVGATKYNAIYSGFAIVIFLLIWLYLGWLILLIGCHLSYFVQHPERLTPQRSVPYLSGRLAEALGLQVVREVGRRFLAGEPAPTLDGLRRSLPGVPEHVDRVIEILLHHGVLAEIPSEGAVERRRLLPGKDLDVISVSQLWQLLRCGLDTQANPDRDGISPEVRRLLESAEAGFAGGAGKKTVRAWLLEQASAAAGAGPAARA